MAKPQRDIQIRHKGNCASLRGGNCNCNPAYKAEIWIAHESRKVRRSFPTLAAARAWRHDALAALRKGTRAGGSPTTIREAAAALVTGIRSGAIRTRSGDEYKPSARRNYEEALRKRILPRMGHMLIVEVTRGDVQRFVDHLLASGISTEHDPQHGQPAAGDLPPGGARTARWPSTRRSDCSCRRCAGSATGSPLPRRPQRCSSALPDRDRAIWATAMYAGLRRGETAGADVVRRRLRDGR